MTRTYRITPSTPRQSRLARATTKAHDEARTLFYAVREARDLYELETRELATRRLADAMEHATTRDHVTISAEPEPVDFYDWRIR